VNYLGALYKDYSIWGLDPEQIPVIISLIHLKEVFLTFHVDIFIKSLLNIFENEYILKSKREKTLGAFMYYRTIEQEDIA